MHKTNILLNLAEGANAADKNATEPLQQLCESERAIKQTTETDTHVHWVNKEVFM